MIEEATVRGGYDKKREGGARCIRVAMTTARCTIEVATVDRVVTRVKRKPEAN